MASVQSSGCLSSLEAQAVRAGTIQTKGKDDVGANGISTTGKDASAKSALARSLTGTLAFYFKRPVRLFRPTRVSAWTAFNEMAKGSSKGTSVDRHFLRSVIAKQGWFFFAREAFPPLLLNSIVGFTLFSTYTITESMLKYSSEGYDISPYAIPFISGATAGAAQSIISSPLDNVRAVLAAQSLSTKGRPAKWNGWRAVAVQAMFPRWLTSTSPVLSTPLTFLSNWWRSSWSLFTFTLLRDSLGFAVFFTIFEGSRTLAKRAGKAVDRLQVQVESRSRSIGVDLERLLENNMLDRGWPGRVVQAIVIVLCGVFAGVGYGVVGRPFDKARTTIWNGLEDWAKERRQEAKEAEEREAHRSSVRDNAARVGSPAIGSIPKTPIIGEKMEAKSAPLTLSHRKRHQRLAAHETRLPLHPPRSAEPPKHPLRKPSKLRDPSERPSKSLPSAFSLLGQAYRREGLLSMLGFSAAASGTLGSLLPSKSVLSRAQLAKSTLARKRSPSSAQGTLQALAEHPALGGTAVFDNLPPPSESLLKRAHRRPRVWRAQQQAQNSTSTSASFARRVRNRFSGRFTVTNVFRVIPPYCIGFLVYALMSDDFSR